ncbi:MAG: NERD domain-containing protein [Proteobacteria bacterium]|nr:NERD domain-containing protein [Pseudomonadota bacterium]MBU1649278.1 NERD domain-containing protein [Pseudomonadota bacterium]MBU1986371.1 NERD domain-containing protein [Pseudomonadota bacterium]
MRKKIAQLDDQINDQIFLFAVTPVVLAGFILGGVLVKGGNPTLANYLTLIFALAIFLPIPLVKFARRFRERSNYQLGLDAELAVGRELNLIMRQGFYVFHDFPEEHNNIDHVVVGPSGVFAVETKGRSKPDKGRGAVDAKVIYNGEALYFPDKAKETAAIHQARKQATTLSKWLSSAVGEPVMARPVLALPGWFVERKKPDDLILLYGKSDNYARSLKGPEVLSENMIKRIVHQLETKCRDVEPIAYSGNKKKQS